MRDIRIPVQVMHSVNLNRFTAEDSWNLFLSQLEYPQSVLGRRAGEGIYTGSVVNDGPTGEFRREAIRRIEEIPAHAHIAVLSEHPGYASAFDALTDKANTDSQIIVTRLGYYRRPGISDAKPSNTVALSLPGFNEPKLVDQFSLSVEDISRGAVSGQHVHFIEAGDRVVAVVNCHDYTHLEILKCLHGRGADCIIVPTFNPASRLYEQYATSDIHRFFAFVVISNIANYGGSGIYAPFRRNGPTGSAISMRGALATSRGASQQSMTVELPIKDLKTAKNEFAADKTPTMKWMQPIYPPGGLSSASQPYIDVLQRTDSVKELLIDESVISKRHTGDVRVAVAHLKGLEVADYLNSRYHISTSPNGPEHDAYVTRRIKSLADDLRANTQTLEFLVFPEVFLQLDQDAAIRAFAKEFGTVVIGGFEYDDNSSPGENRCRIYVPKENGDVDSFTYWKLTRSQYDARLPKLNEMGVGEKFPFKLGQEMLVFNTGRYRFGVLICYDFSHYDVMYTINSKQHSEPVDILFVVSYNPDAETYRQCCLSDSHRFYQYVVICNVAQFGGSGAFGPIKTPGERQTIMHAGSGVDAVSIASLDIDCLQKARESQDNSLPNSFMKKPGIYSGR